MKKASSITFLAVMVLFMAVPTQSFAKKIKFGSCFSCRSIYTAFPIKETAHIYTWRREPIFIRTYTGIPGLSD